MIISESVGVEATKQQQKTLENEENKCSVKEVHKFTRVQTGRPTSTQEAKLLL